ncbi:MAG: hypothetical protein JWQ25_2175, partial [Daejeonella sp.]|nr:hypothetical protein [Daejeonella sp.]
MKFFSVATTIYMVLMSFVTFGQTPGDTFIKGKNDTITVALTMVDNEMIPWLPAPEVTITATRIFKSPEERMRFNRLRYNVLKVMPYARFAKIRYAKLQFDLASTPKKRDQKILVKAFEIEIKNMFNSQIKNLTITQGGILIKLIDRETGTSSYDLLKDMKGGFNAFFYQSVARVFGNNLKSKYDPEEDHDIEDIIKSYPYYSYN